MAEFEDYTTDDFQGDSASQQSTPAMAYGTSPHSNTPSARNLEHQEYTPSRYYPPRPDTIRHRYEHGFYPYHQSYTPEDWSVTSPFGCGQHNEMLSTMLTKQDEMKKLIDAMSARMDVFEKSLLSMKQTSSSSSNNSSADIEKKRVSPELSKNVASIHEGLDEERQFKPSLGSKDDHNKSVKKHITEEIILKQENTYTQVEIQKAIQRYFESRRRIWRETNNPDQQERVSKQTKCRRRRSRKIRLYNRRKKVVHAGEEIQRFNKLTIDFMSEESSDSDGGNNITVHRPVWRSRVLNSFLQELDKRIVAQQNDTKKHIPERRERELGDHVSSYPPPTAPNWTIDKDWLKDHADYRTSE